MPASPNPPVNTVPGTAITIGRDDSYTFSDGSLQVSDADGDYLYVEIIASSGGLRFGDSFLESRVYLQGTADEINADLLGLTFTPSDAGTATLTITTSDGYGYSYNEDSDMFAFDVVSFTVEDVTETYRDTARDDEFASAEGSIATSAYDPFFELDGYTVQSTIYADGMMIEGAHGTLHLDLDGDYTFVPNDVAVEELRSSVSEQFSFSVTESEGDAVPGEVTIVLNGANDRPTLDASLDEATFTDTSADDDFDPVTGQLTHQDRDSGDGHAYGIVGGAASGGGSSEVFKTGRYGTLFVDSVTGAYRFEPDADAIEALKGHASETFTLRVVDAGGLAATQAFTVSLSGANDAPEASITRSTILILDTRGDDAPAPVGGILSSEDRDQGDNATFGISGGGANATRPGFDTAKAGSFGTLFLNSATGAYLYVPSDSAVEGLTSAKSETFSLTATDESGAADAQALTVTVRGVNDAPEIDPSDLRADYADTAGDDSFAPVARTLAASDRDAGDSLAYGIVGGTPVGPGSVEVAKAGRYGTLILDTLTGAYRFEPDAAAIQALKGDASETFTLRVRDAGGLAATQAFTVSIDGANDTPVASVSRGAIAVADTRGDDTFGPVGGVLSAADRDAGDSPAFGIVGGGASAARPGFDLAKVGAAGTLFLNSRTGAYLFVPDDAAVEALKSTRSETFTFTATDETGGTDSQDVTVTVRGANDAPEMTSPAPRVAYRDTAGDDSFSAFAGTLAASDRDAGDGAAFGIVGGAPQGALSGFDLAKAGATGTLHLNSVTGAYRFVPDDGALEALKGPASESFTVFVRDSSGARATQAVTVNVTGANDRPTLAASLTNARYADTAGDDAFAPVTGQLTAGDRDGAESLVFGIVGANAGLAAAAAVRVAAEIVKTGRYGALILDPATGAYRYEPDAGAIEALARGETATERFTLTVTDGSGAVATQVVTIAVTGADDRPDLVLSVPVAAYADTDADDAFGAVTGRAQGADRDDGGTLVYGIAGGGASSRAGFDVAKTGTFGTLHLNSLTGAYLFEPDDQAIEGLKGPAVATFALTVTDGSGATASETFTVNLDGANDRPEAAGDAYATTQGEALTVRAAAGVLANDSDRDGDALDAVLASGPRHGALRLNADGSFTYTPDAGFSGTDSFTYRAGDGSVRAAPVTVTITVEPDAAPPNRPPAATDDAVRAAESPTTLAAQAFTGNVLSNDSDPDAGDGLRVTALDGANLGARLVLEGRYGTLTLWADGRYSYALRNTDALIGGETGTERFVYTVSDEGGRTDNAALTFTIDGSDLNLTAGGTVFGQRGDDRITGLDGADRITGREGSDILRGGEGDDTLWGEVGDDVIDGGAGEDQGVGGAGDDRIALGLGDDRGWGEAGDDSIAGGLGDDRIDGGAGNDSVDLGEGDDRGWGGLGTDAIAGGAGADWLSGESGNDALDGGLDDDELWGGAGDDDLVGGLGDDRMSAGSGDDRIEMGAGDDVAWGGSGADRFVFAAGFGRDVIKDFGAGDRIVFDGVFGSFSAVQAAMRQDGADIVITARGQTITIENVSRLDAGDFDFL